MKTTLVLLSLLPLVAFAQANARENFLREQAYAEMQRVTGEIGALQSSVEDLRVRLGKIESAGSGESALRAEIASLKSAVAELRQELANQRTEIVKDLSSRLAKMQPKDPPPASPKTVVVSSPTSTYTVQSGDSLYLISKAFNTTVAKIKEMNALRSDNLKIGQKLIVPQN